MTSEEQKRRAVSLLQAIDSSDPEKMVPDLVTDGVIFQLMSRRPCAPEIKGKCAFIEHIRRLHVMFPSGFISSLAL